MTFRRRVFATESELIGRAARLLGRTRRIRVAWLGFIVLSLGAHLVVAYLSRGNLFGVPAPRPDPPLTELRLVVRIPAPPPPIPEPAPVPRLPPVQPLPPPAEAAADPSPGPPVAGTSPAVAAPPEVIGIGAGGVGNSHGGGGGYGTGAGGRGALLAEFGGTSETEEAVRRGLEWLARHQNADGRWDCDGFERCCPPETHCGGKGHPQYDVGVTALALAAFQAQGAAAVPQWDAAAAAALEFLLGTVQPAGNFGPQEANFMYNQALAVYSVARAHRARPAPALAAVLTRALDFAARARQEGGGWDYTSQLTGRNDLSITGWQLLAFDACKDAGMTVPDLAPSLAMVRNARHTRSGLVVYADKGLGQGQERAGLVPVALLGLLLCGQSVDTPQARTLADTTLRMPPNPGARGRWPETGQSLYYWYYGTLALFHMGGPWWREWNPAMQAALLALQRTDGHRAGSWDPDPSWIGDAGGRVYATAMAVLTLEVYYRVRPKHLDPVLR